jgi:hypothetical protein
MFAKATSKESRFFCAGVGKRIENDWKNWRFGKAKTGASAKGIDASSIEQKARPE